MNLVSVIVCTRNRAELLKEVLESLLRQEKSDFDYEILVVDNNSTDDTRSVIEGFILRFEGRLRPLFQPIQGKSTSLNMAIPQAKGDIIAFTDDDVTIDPRWLLNIMECFRMHHCDGVGGRVLPVYPERTPRWARENPHQAAGAVVIYDQGEDIVEFNNSMEIFIGANFAFRRDIFNECGMFRTDLIYFGMPINEDREFIRRVLKTGKTLYYCGKAIVWHPVSLRRLKFGHMVRWHMAAGRCAANLENENKESEFVYILGIPRYIIKGICIDFWGMLFNIFNRVEFFRNFRGFFRKAGMIWEYRLLARSQ